MTYLEKHSAFNSRFVAWFLAVPNVVMAVLLALTFYWAAVAGAVGAAGFVLIITWTMAYRNWPTGIRIDDDGVGVGAVSSRRAERRKRRIGAVHEAWGLFFCPWDGVLAIAVVTESDELGRIRQAGALVAPTNRWGKPAGSRLHKGVLTGPFMRAALVVQVDPTRATVPATYASRFYSNRPPEWRSKDAGLEGAIWIVPTRRGGELREAVSALPAFQATTAAVLEQHRLPKFHL